MTNSETGTALFLLLLCATVTEIVFSYDDFDHVASCHQSERQALLELKSDLTDPSNRLASWTHSNGSNCCDWYGVVCDDSTGHVHELHLHSFCWIDLINDKLYSSFYQSYDDYLRTIFGGKINPSLQNLKYLRYLDLSCNDFRDVRIPIFLGSMSSLRHLNLSQAGFGGIIPPQLGNLSNLQYLNLQSKYLYDLHSWDLNWISGLHALEFLDLSSVRLASNWLKATNMLPSLRELHMSQCSLGSVPPLLHFNFSSLSVLDLSSNGLNRSFFASDFILHLKSIKSLNLAANLIQGPIPNVLQNMTSLVSLDLSFNKIGGNIPTFFGKWTSLVSLDLSINEIGGNIPTFFGNWTSLVSLDLSSNEIGGNIPTFFGNWTSLVSLDLSSNEIGGNIPTFFGNWTSLVSLHLSFNLLEGNIPPSFKNLCKLRRIDLSGSKLGQKLNEILEILSGCISSGLEYLSLGSCQLSGHFTNRLSQFKNLEYLDLGNNFISGNLPDSVGSLSELKVVHVSYNSLAGEITEIHFENLTKLRGFFASGNQLILKVSPQWTPPFLDIVDMILASWKTGPQFPTWIHSLKHLLRLDLSNSGISTPFPDWFWKWSNRLEFLDLSNNGIPGVLPNAAMSLYHALKIDLSANHLTGPLPCGFANATEYLNLSNNSLSGTISDFLCCNLPNLTREMLFLNLEGNMFDGEIPDCWQSFPTMEILRLSDNNFTGHVPESIGDLSSLSSLHLRNNNLSGDIPKGLHNCTDLQELDLSENEFEGSVPKWVGGLFNLVILNFRANNLHGDIPKELCQLYNLQILDLAENYLSGSIPTCIKNLTAMTSTKPNSIEMELIEILIQIGPSEFVAVLENAFIVMKGSVAEYNTILYLVKSIDLSSNKLSGEIPEAVTNLTDLISLNLSNNLLIGQIPRGMGAMRSLECIDLSNNQLSGEIPQSMTKLNLLNHLNLSSNNLSGRIPSSTQLQSLNASCFSGNKELCGPPLTNNCSVGATTLEHPEQKEKEDNGIDMDWYMSIIIGFAVGFWGVLGPLIICRQWRYAFYGLVDWLGYIFIDTFNYIVRIWKGT